MEKESSAFFRLRCFIFPKNNHWFRRILLVFAFIFFDYISTMAFCRFPFEEANVYARFFMEIFGVQAGLTLFVFIANFPIYAVLSLDSHLVRFPQKIGALAESFTDFVFAWFIAGLHFSGGTSWFWWSPDIVRQFLGATLYLVMAFIFVKPYRACYGNEEA